MSTPISTASPPRLLRPVTQKIQNDGAAFVRLSPHKGVRNATIIYEAIRKLPDQTLIRGDFDKQSRPLIYFPERPPKRVGKLPVDSVAACNIRCDRAEFASFMKSIVDAAYTSARPHAPELRAAFDLRYRTMQISSSGRDFTVGDIREPLRSIAKSFYRKQLRNVTSPHRTPQGSESSLQAKRFRQFASVTGDLLEQLGAALGAGIGKGRKAEAKAMNTIDAMKQMLVDYRILRDKENLEFGDFLLKQAIPRDAYLFAKLWLALKDDDRDDRTAFCTESWALEMDRVCPLIINAYKAAALQKAQSPAHDQQAPADKSSEAAKPAPDKAPGDAKAQPLTLPPASPGPRALKRRFIRKEGSHAGDPAWLSPTLKKQSSVPRLRVRPDDESDYAMRRRDSFNLNPRPLFAPSVTYRAINTSGTAEEAFAAQAPVSVIPGGPLEAGMTHPREQ